MTELKTLKDLGYKEPTNWRKNCRIAWNDFVYIKDLRAEAIKWVKEDIRLNLGTITPTILRWINRFNLTEEEVGK